MRGHRHPESFFLGGGVFVFPTSGVAAKVLGGGVVGHVLPGKF